VVIHHKSLGGLLAEVRAGFGLAVLPCMVADQDPDLIRCLPPAESGGRGLWLLTHERLRHTPRVRTVMDFLFRNLKRLAIRSDALGRPVATTPPLAEAGAGAEGPARP
jgi:DNA-binding transcriptional LysR family regulator